MRRLKTALLISAAVLAASAVAQDKTGVSIDAQSSLKIEWRDLTFYGDPQKPKEPPITGVARCLKALDLYANGDDLEALRQLTLGATNPKPPDPPPSPSDPDPTPGANSPPKAAKVPPTASSKFYPIAQKLGRMPELLATATTLTIDKTKSSNTEDLFKKATQAIQTFYRSKPDRLDREVNRVYANHPLRALYKLLAWYGWDLQFYTPDDQSEATKAKEAAAAAKEDAAKACAQNGGKNCAKVKELAAMNAAFVKACLAAAAEAKAGDAAVTAKPADPSCKAAAAVDAVKLMEVFRTCYAIDRDQLFSIVHKLFM